MKIDPQRLQLASALDSGSDSDSSREEGEIRSVDLPPKSSPSRDPRHQALYNLQDELRRRKPEFVKSFEFAYSLKNQAAGSSAQGRRASPVVLPRPSSSSASPNRPSMSRAQAARAASFVLVKSPEPRDVRRHRSRSRSKSHGVRNGARLETPPPRHQDKKKHRSRSRSSPRDVRSPVPRRRNGGKRRATHRVSRSPSRVSISLRWYGLMLGHCKSCKNFVLGYKKPKPRHDEFSWRYSDPFVSSEISLLRSNLPEIAP